VPRKVNRDYIEIFIQAGVLKSPQTMLSAGAVNEKHAFFMITETPAINPAGNFRGINAKVFQHNQVSPYVRHVSYNNDFKQSNNVFPGQFILTQRDI
jgi:hypothetical protein